MKSSTFWKAVLVDRDNLLEQFLPVARIDDLLRGKIWAAMDSSGRPSKQLKDLSDIARILEVAPELRSEVPKEILAKIPGQSA